MVSHCSALVINKDIRDVLIVDDTVRCPLSPLTFLRSSSLILDILALT